MTVVEATEADRLASYAAQVDEGGVLRLVAGMTYEMGTEPVRLPHGSSVEGNGATIVGRPPGYPIIVLEQSTKVTIRNVALEGAPMENHKKWVSLIGCSDITFDHVIISDIGGHADSSWTNLGVLAEDCTDIMLDHCDLYGTQVKLGPGYIRRATVRHCRFFGPLQYAVSFVVLGPGSSAEGLHIDSCVVVDPRGNGGFYIGEDGHVSSPGGVCRDVLIEDCTVAGRWPASENTGGIKAFLCETSADWTFRRNRIIPDRAQPKTSGILAVQREGVRGSIRGLNIEGNTVINVDGWGISLDGAADHPAVANNYLANTRGISIHAGADQAITGAAVHDNTVRQGRYGLRVGAQGGGAEVFHGDNWWQATEACVEIGEGDVTLVEDGPNHCEP
jgi:hypothetical protein